jgi:predicted ester cyclase
MSVEQNKAILKRMYDEVWNKGNLSIASELISPDYHHLDYKGPDGWKQIVTMQRNAFPDIHYTVDQVIGEGDWLAYKLTVQGTFNGKGEIWGVKPTGKIMKWQWWFFSQYKDGKLLSSTAAGDMLSFYQQVGASPVGWEITKK